MLSDRDMTDDEITDVWAEGLVAALGGLVEKGVIEIDRSKSARPGVMLSDFLTFTQKGVEIWNAFTREAMDEFPVIDDMESYRISAIWLSAKHPEYTDFEVYGILAWGNRVWSEYRARHERSDGLRRAQRRQVED